MISRPLATGCAAALMAFASCFLPCAAAPLPDAILQKSELSQADRDQVAEFIRAHLEGIASEDPAANRAARDEILATIAKGVSVAVRLEMSNALLADLRRLVASPNERVSFNASRIAGALATPSSLDVIAAAIADKRPAVRYGGAAAARRTLEEQAARRSPIDAAQARNLLGALAQDLRSDNDPGVIDGLITAFQAAGPDIRSEAMTLMASSIAEQGATFGRKDRGGDPDIWARAFRRAVSAAQKALLDQLKIGKPDAAFAKATAEMSGVMIAHAVRRLDAARASVRSEAEMETLRALVADAEGTLILVNKNINQGATEIEQRLGNAFDSAASAGDSAQLRAEASTWIGPEGVLAKPPYSFDPRRFDSK